MLKQSGILYLLSFKTLILLYMSHMTVFYFPDISFYWRIHILKTCQVYLYLSRALRKEWNCKDSCLGLGEYWEGREKRNPCLITREQTSLLQKVVFHLNNFCPKKEINIRSFSLSCSLLVEKSFSPFLLAFFHLNWW